MNFSKYKVIIAGVLIVALTVVGIVVAANVLTSNHIVHPDALPTPTPAPVVPTSVTLSANDTGIMAGDYITFTAQLDKAVTGISIKYYNNGTYYSEYFSDASGRAVFTRGPFWSAYDVHVTATIP